MGRGRKVSEIFPELRHSMCYLGTGLHTLGLLIWLLEKTGAADVWLSTFSTSEEFLAGFCRLRRTGLVRHAVCMGDFKASRKTLKLERLFRNAFDEVYLCQNHSKVLLIRNEQQTVSVITSQNQTYGDRAECTIVTTDPEIFSGLHDNFQELSLKALEIWKT